MRTAAISFDDVSTMAVPDLFRLRVQETPGKLAVHSVQGTLTFGAWGAQAASIAELLESELGPLRGERIALWMTNDEATAYVSALQATFEVGGVAVSLDDRYVVPEVRRILLEAEPRALLIGPQVAERLGAGGFADLGLAAWDAGAGDSWDVLLAPVAAGAIAGQPTTWVAGGDRDATSARRVARPEDYALIAYTSGSTGTPKGAVWTQAAICQYAERVAHATYAVPRGGAQLAEADVLQSPIPLYTAASLIENIYPTVLSGCELVFEGRRFQPEPCEERMAAHGTTVFNGVPAIFALLCDLPETRPGASPELMVTSGSAITSDLYRRMRERWPQTSIANWYGLNESGTGQTLNHGDDMARHPGSIGRPLPPTEVRVVDADLQPVPAGTEGDLLMRAPGQMPEYFRNPEQTASRFRGDWLFTGDRVMQDEDGLLHVVGRNEERINRGGFKFYPAEIESALEEHAAVREAAVIAVPHPVLGQDAVAFVVPAGASALDEPGLRSYLRTQVAPNKVPARVIAVDALPRGAYGKVIRRELLARYHETELQPTITPKESSR